MTYTANVFFAGCGGSSAGLEQAGFKVLYAQDFDANILAIHRNNHPLAQHEVQDVRQSDVQNIIKADLHWYSPPCQVYSKANRNKPTKEDMSIGQAIAAINFLHKPKVVILENVPEYFESESYLLIKTQLTDAKYKVFETKLNAKDCGVPQDRVRKFLIAFYPTVGVNKVDYLGPVAPISWYEALYTHFDAMDITFMTTTQFEKVKKQPKGVYLVQRIGYGKSGPVIRASCEVCNTITASMGNDHKLNKEGHPNFRSPYTVVLDDRCLKVDVKELGILQGFPYNHNWGKHKGTAGKAIGNSVPPGMAKRLGEWVKLHLSN